MREILTDKNYIKGKLIVIAKLLLILCLVIFFAPLVILPFFNHPCADDYISGYHLSNKNFWEYQSFIYNNWGGRFAATFAGSLFAKRGYLYDHYWLHSLLLLVLNMISAIFMLFTLNKHILKNSILQKNIASASLLFVALQICLIVEPSTYIFWFSSAITYQLPVVLLQLQIGLWILLLHATKPYLRSSAYLLLPILVFTINGFNELFIIAQAVLLLFIFLTGANRKLSKTFILVTVVVFVTSAFIVVLSPGIHSRTTIIVPKGIWVGIVAVMFHVGETLWSICKSPFFWLTFTLAFLYGNHERERFNKLNWVRMLNRKQWLLSLVIFVFLIVSIGIAVTGLKGGLIPERYVNGVICLSSGLILLAAFIAGIGFQNLHLDFYSQRSGLIILVLTFVALLSNTYTKEAYKGIISAPLYDAIMDEREMALREAATAHQPAILKSYDHAMKEHLKKKYSNSTQTLYNLVQQKPSFIFFEDDLSTEYSIGTLKNFYAVDTITVK